MKELCKCGSMAVWVYIPGYSGGGSPFHCDDCVPRGCSCEDRYINSDFPEIPTIGSVEGKDWKWIEKDICWVSIDKNGRQYPCVEYDYSENGYEIEDDD